NAPDNRSVTLNSICTKLFNNITYFIEVHFQFRRTVYCSSSPTYSFSISTLFFVLILTFVETPYIFFRNGGSSAGALFGGESECIENCTLGTHLRLHPASNTVSNDVCIAQYYADSPVLPVEFFGPTSWIKQQNPYCYSYYFDSHVSASDYVVSI
ncbi:hypothetical protein L9F63_024800, partial [Diploptera punctata]